MTAVDRWLVQKQVHPIILKEASLSNTHTLLQPYTDLVHH